MGYAACFDNALPVAAKQLGLAPTATRTSVEVGIGQTAAGGYALYAINSDAATYRIAGLVASRRGMALQSLLGFALPAGRARLKVALRVAIDPWL